MMIPLSFFFVFFVFKFNWTFQESGSNSGSLCFWEIQVERPKNNLFSSSEGSANTTEEDSAASANRLWL